jgi:hypothetical protein
MSCCNLLLHVAIHQQIHGVKHILAAAMPSFDVVLLGSIHVGRLQLIFWFCNAAAVTT